MTALIKPLSACAALNPSYAAAEETRATLHSGFCFSASSAPPREITTFVLFVVKILRGEIKTDIGR